MADSKDLLNIGKKELNELTSIKDSIDTLNTSVERANNYFKPWKIILRAMTTGIFSALGATVGLALLLFSTAKIMDGVSAIPILNNLLKETKLDIIIDHQLQQIEATPTTSEENT